MAAEQTIPITVEGKAPTAREKTRAEERYVSPPVDIYETKEGLTVVIDMPGVEKDGIEVNADNEILTMKGLVKHSAPGSPVYSEFKLMDYFRQFQLTEEVDIDKISADLKQGVLTIQLPKAERAKPKKIPISVA